jgi:hypothetical protein
MTCDREKELVRAARGGALSAEQTAHADSCPTCTDIAVAGAFMAGLARTLSVPPLPTADQIWARAQLLMREPRFVRTMQTVHVLGWSTLAAIPAIWLAIGWPRISAWLGALQGGELAWPAGTTGISWSLLWMAAAIVAAATLLTAQMIFAEE